MGLPFPEKVRPGGADTCRGRLRWNKFLVVRSIRLTYAAHLSSAARRFTILNETEERVARPAHARGGARSLALRKSKGA